MDLLALLVSLAATVGAVFIFSRRRGAGAVAPALRQTKVTITDVSTVDPDATGGLDPRSFGGAGFVTAPASPKLAGGDPAGQPAQELLARTLWGEARSESQEGVRAVGEIIRNRVQTNFRGKATYQGVILDRLQISSWDASDPNRAKMLALTFENSLFRALYDLAGEIISRRNLVFGDKAWRHYLNPDPRFYANGELPAWTKAATATRDIGRHRFYKGVS